MSTVVPEAVGKATINVLVEISKALLAKIMTLFFLKNIDGPLLSVGCQEDVEDAEDDEDVEDGAGQDVSEGLFSLIVDVPMVEAPPELLPSLPERFFPTSSRPEAAN